MSNVPDPIHFSTLIQHFTSDAILKRPKDILIKQFEDLVTISQFLLNRIPTNLKYIKQYTKTQRKNIRDHLTAASKRDLKLVIYKFQNSNFNLKAAFQQMSHFCNNKQIDKEFVEKTIPQKQIKLKFLQSQNLPNDLVWYKPSNKARFGQQKTNQSYYWYGHFNAMLNLIQIVAKKHRILVGLTIENNQYRWAIHQIQLKINQQNMLQFIDYFYNSLMPKLKQKYKESYQQNMLACIDAYSYFLQLLQINQIMCGFASVPFFTQNITIKYNQKSYLLKFSLPQPLINHAFIVVTQADVCNFKLVILFRKKQTLAEFHIGNQIVFYTYQLFKYDNCFDILAIFTDLIKFGQNYLKFLNKMNRELPDLLQCSFIKRCNIFWTYQQPNQQKKSANFMPPKADGVYIGKKIQNRLVFCNILPNGKLNSDKISRLFLNKLLKYVPKLSIIFYFMYVIETINEDTQKKQHQLEHYTVREQNKLKGNIDEQINHTTNLDRIKVSLYFRKKNNFEDLMVRSAIKNPLVTDEQNFNSYKSQAQFNISFTQLAFFHFNKDPQQVKFPFNFNQKFDYKRHFNRGSKTDSNSLLDLSKIFEAIRYIQQNTILRCFIEKRIKPDSRQFFKILI